MFLGAALYFYQNHQTNNNNNNNNNNNTARRSFQENANHLYTQAFRRCTSCPEMSQVNVPLGTPQSTGQKSTPLTSPSSTKSMTTTDQKQTTNSNNNDGSSNHNSTEITTTSVRQEWWNAVFGVHFLPLDDPDATVPQQGVGLAGIPSFRTVSAVVHAVENEKLGMTIHRLPLGLHVQAVQPNSEAFLAGVPVNAVLVAINGVALLAEPSAKALERVWQYQGLYNDAARTNHSNGDGAMGSPIANHGTTATNPATAALLSDEVVATRQPQLLQFIHGGKLFSCLLFTSHWGISWAPCGNFPLIKRVYAAAEKAQVPRGSILTAVNHVSLRERDHAETAVLLQQQQALNGGTNTVQLVCAFTPMAARPPRVASSINGNHHSTMTGHTATGTASHSSNTRRRKPTKLQHDGVEVTFHPLSTAFCNSTVTSACTTSTTDDSSAEQSVSALAEQIAAGIPHAHVDSKRYWQELQPPKHFYPPCPALPPDQVLKLWDPLIALVACLQVTATEHNAEQNNDSNYSDLLRPLPVTATEEQALERLQALTTTTSSSTPTESTLFVLQFISLICSTTASANTSKELTSLLLKISRKDESFCQYLYFLLRSFISTFETRRSGSERNLMALLHCLELLRFAEKELASRPIQLMQTPELAPSQPEAAVEEKQVDGPRKRSVLNIFRKKKTKKKDSSRPVAAPAPPTGNEPLVSTSTSNDPPQISMSLSQSPSTMYENMSDFLSELDRICGTIERSLQKSFRQKIAEWAMQPWSASKDTALAQVTASMRESLRQANENSSILLVNPVESAELLSGVDFDECYILPSAHFPILLTFNVSERKQSKGDERLYQTTVEVLGLHGSSTSRLPDEGLIVQGAMAGTIDESGESCCQCTDSGEEGVHTWQENLLDFENRSSWGAPQTLSLRVSTRDPACEVGFGWVDLSSLYHEDPPNAGQSCERTATLWPIHSAEGVFDEHGDWSVKDDALKLRLKITTKCVDLENSTEHVRKRMLLYKHDDDLRQEAFTVQFIKTCDQVLRSSGLDMKLLTFECIPVGTRRGFVEWVPGSVPLSEICQPFAGSLLSGESRRSNSDDDSAPSMVAKAGLTKYESLRRLQHTESLRRLGGAQSSPRGSMDNNPVQDYLRSVAYDADAPYLIRKEVMDRYVKSCAGYSVITYILGVGDRHLDNLLLHQSGAFFHCDYSFILGSDPKRYLPMRITEDMVHGMGGRESDNYAKFLSLTGAVFLTLRRPEYVRVLLSMVRMMEASWLPDVSENQTIHQAIMGMCDRMRLDLSEDQALTFMEDLVESSLSSKMWLAVDAIHNLGKRINIS